MALLCPANVCVPGLWVRGPSSSSVTRKLLYKRRSVSVTKIRAFFDAPPPPDDPILKEALKEPVAFLGGVFVGLLRLDLKEDPLKEWVARTAQAAGLTGDGEPQSQEETPRQIEIE